MAHNSLLRPTSGDWSYNSVITEAEFWAFDLGIFESINGDQGGLWAPATRINIGGEGLGVSGTLFECTSNATFDGTVTCNAAATFDAAVTCNALLTCSNGLTVSSGLLQVASGAEFGSTVSVDGVLTCNGNIDGSGGTLSADAATLASLVVSGTLDVSGNVDFGNDVDVQGDLECFSTVQLKGDVALTAPIVGGTNGRVVKRVVAGADADTNYAIGAVDVVRVLTATPLSANRTYTLQNAGAQDGDTILFVSEIAGFHADIKKEGSPTSLGQLKFAAGFYRMLEFMFQGGTWSLLNRELL